MKIIFLLSLSLLSFFVKASGDKLFEIVILQNVKTAIQITKKLEKTIENAQQNMAQKQFKNLIVAWKKVEATYILGNVDEDFLDTPRYLDIFHGNNEDIKKQLDLVVNTSDVLNIALYKHSYKTINALEIMLFNYDFKNPRVQKINLVIIESIKKYLVEILTAYQKNQQKLTDKKNVLDAYLLNVLIAETYKLNQWRIGDVAGVSKKYQTAKQNRSEYFISGNSLLSIQTVLKTHQQIINSPNYEDLGDIAKKNQATKEINQTIKLLKKAINDANNMQEMDLSGQKGRVLFETTKKLLNAYYVSLLDKLGFVGKILDADGD